jgi:general secretion pathway protein D
VPRTMVFVEALIMEVSAAKSMDLGVEWRGADSFHGGFGEGSKGGLVLGGSPGASSVDALAAGALPQGFAAGVVGRAISFDGVVFPSFGAFIRAVQSDSNFNIISTPQILTLDNAEAVIEVGQNIPFVTRVDQPAQVTERAIQTFEYRDVGVTLKVTPQINDNRQVMLKVEQSIKSVVERTALGGTVLAPTTTFRRAKTAITVMDGETAVIGGLIEDRMDRGKTQTPCLGGVPGLGWLFKSINDRDEKTNLLVFLAPHIVENPGESRKLYEEKRGKIDLSVGEAMKNNQPEKLRRMLFE